MFPNIHLVEAETISKLIDPIIHKVVVNIDCHGTVPKFLAFGVFFTCNFFFFCTIETMIRVLQPHVIDHVCARVIAQGTSKHSSVLVENMLSDKVKS